MARVIRRSRFWIDMFLLFGESDGGKNSRVLISVSVVFIGLVIRGLPDAGSVYKLRPD
jgi:hypothetical protein